MSKKKRPDEYSLILKLLAHAMFGAPLPEDTVLCDGGQALYSLAVSQAVCALVYDGAVALGLSEEIKKKWTVTIGKIYRQNENLFSVQDSLCGLLENNGFCYTVIKGLSAALPYPEPAKRSFGDIDLLIEPSELEKICKLLSENAYTASDGQDTDYHTAFYKNGVEIELHIHPRIPDNDAGQVIRRYLGNILSDSSEAVFEGHAFRRPAPVENALVMLMHIYEHMRHGGLGLRQICDWAVFASSDEFAKEQDKVLCALSDCGLLCLAEHITMTCVRYLGLQPERAQWCSGAEQSVCESLIDDFLDSGNFGRNRKDLYASSSLFTDEDPKKKRSKAGRLFFNLKKVTNKSLPSTKRHPVLLPFGIIFISCRYFVRMLAGKRPRINPVKLASHSSARIDMYEKLNVYKIK